MSSNSFPDASGASRWRKSSYSAGDGGDCLEVADGLPAAVPVRDSKNPHGPALAFRPGAWASFVGAVKAGAFHGRGITAAPARADTTWGPGDPWADVRGGRAVVHSIGG